MCLGIPGKIEELKDTMATVSFGTVKRLIDIRLVENAAVGDYVLVHAGFAIHKISEREALETLELIRQLVDSQNTE